MDIDVRLRNLRLIEKINMNQLFSEQLGVRDITRFHGELVVSDLNKQSSHNKR